MSGFTMDVKDFQKNMAELAKNTIPKVVGNALFKAGALVIRDAILEEPTCPKKTGNLRRTQKVLLPDISRDEIGVDVGFNADYAAKVHELPEKTNWTLPGSGPKYLSSKLARNKDKYMKFAADDIAKVAKSS